MYKKPLFGYLLITMLIISGLAGIPTNNSLTKKERKFALDYMKNSKGAVLDVAKKLSETQLNYKSSADKWSIKECIYHIAISEANLWNMIESSLKSAANPEKRIEIKMSDEQVVKMIEDRSMKVKTVEPFEPRNTPYKTVDEALSFFKSSRNDHIRHIKSSTEDMRNHVVQMPFGWLDCYQLCLFMTGHTNRHLKQIEEVKMEASFPK